MAKGPSGDSFQDMCTMIGTMTIVWAYAENAVAIIIGIVEERQGPIKGWDKLPLAAESKAECLKDVFRDTARLEAIKQDGRALAISFKALSKRRNDIMHGAVWETSDGSFKSVAIKIQAGRSLVFEHAYSHREAADLVGEITLMADKAAALLSKVEIALR